MGRGSTGYVDPTLELKLRPRRIASCVENPEGGPAIGKVAKITARGAIYASSDLPSMVRFDRARATLSGPLHPSDVARLSAMVPAVT